MNGLTRDFIRIPSATSLMGSARLTNFNPDKLIFTVRGESAVTKEDLDRILVTLNFKNSVGSGLAVTNNLPLKIVANMNDYLYGFGLLGDDKTACFALELGKYILKSDDEVTLNISTVGTLSQALSLYVIAMDSFVGKEQLISWKYIKASATQAYQESGVLDVFGQIKDASENVFITVDDFYGSNNMTELAVCAIGSALGSAEDYDGFGLVFHDPTAMTQPVTVRAGSDNEELLFKEWNFDVNRLGFESVDDQSVLLLARSIAEGNPTKAKCLEYFYS